MSPDSSMASSNDVVMTAAPALFSGATGATGTASGTFDPRMGHITIAEEYKALREWATQQQANATRESALAKAQMQHLISVVGEGKKEMNMMKGEIDQAKAMIQTEVSKTQNEASLLAAAQSKYMGFWNECEMKSANKDAQHNLALQNWREETCTANQANEAILGEYGASCKSLELARQQLAHLAERANQAAMAYEFKDDELKRNALENQKLIKDMNEKADAEKMS